MPCLAQPDDDALAGVGVLHADRRPSGLPPIDHKAVLRGERDQVDLLEGFEFVSSGGHGHTSRGEGSLPLEPLIPFRRWLLLLLLHAIQERLAGCLTPFLSTHLLWEFRTSGPFRLVPNAKHLP